MTFQNDLHIHFLLLHMIVAPAVNINQTINKILLLYLYGRFFKKISFTTTAQNVPHAFFDHSEPKMEKINAIDR